MEFRLLALVLVGGLLLGCTGVGKDMQKTDSELGELDQIEQSLGEDSELEELSTSDISVDEGLNEPNVSEDLGELSEQVPQSSELEDMLNDFDSVDNEFSEDLDFPELDQI